MKSIFISGFALISLALLGFYATRSTAAELAEVFDDPVIFNNGNIYTVYNSPRAPTKIRLAGPTVITSVRNYHWNNARGSTPGTIGFRDAAGREFGPWNAQGSPGQGGVANAYWTVRINLKLAAGEYTIADSEPSTWAQNSGSGYRGITEVRGYISKPGTPPPQPPPTAAPTPGKSSKVTALTENRAKYKVLIWVAGQEPKTPMDVLNYHLEPSWKGALPVNIPPDGRIKFVAGDGSGGPGSMYDKVITSCIWSGDPKDTNRFPHIIFEPGGTLTCSTAQKK